jgi:hypothetical protein
VFSIKNKGMLHTNLKMAPWVSRKQDITGVLPGVLHRCVTQVCYTGVLHRCVTQVCYTGVLPGVLQHVASAL